MEERASAFWRMLEGAAIRVHQDWEAPMEAAHDGRQVAGVCLYRRRSVLVQMTEDGRRLG